MSNVSPIASRGVPNNPARLDAISLERALKDFEVANARVLDLTQRLVESERKRQAIEDELERLRLRLVSAEAENALHLSPRAWRLGVRTAGRVAGRVYARFIK